MLSPAQAARSEQTYTSVVGTLLRVLDLFVQEVTVNDVDTAILYNRALRYLRQARDTAATLLNPAQVAAIFDAPAVPNPFAGKRLLEVSLIRPAGELPAASLSFDPFPLSQMMAMGREAAERVLQAGPRIV